jgi:hypothetical protein
MAPTPAKYFFDDDVGAGVAPRVAGGVPMIMRNNALTGRPSVGFTHFYGVLK